MIFLKQFFTDIKRYEYIDELEEFENNIEEFQEEFLKLERNLQKFYNSSDFKEKFKIMTKVASVLLSVPFSSVHLERLFSNIDINVTPKRNQLGENTLESILINKEDSDLKASLERDIHDKYLQKLFQIEQSFKENPTLIEKNIDKKKSVKLKLDNDEIFDLHSSEIDEMGRYEENDDNYNEINHEKLVDLLESNFGNREVLEEIEISRSFRNLSIEKKVNNKQTTDLQESEIPSNKLRRKREEFERQDKIFQDTQKLRQFTMDYFFNGNK